MIAPTSAFLVKEWPMNEDTNVSAANSPSGVHGIVAQSIGIAVLLLIARLCLSGPGALSFTI
jgi:hypothetical protein